MNSANVAPSAIIRIEMKAADQLISQLDPASLPCHVAIIMDGNGRWARERMRGRSEGHAEGVNSVHDITKFASDLGIKYLTLYAFSTENWNRPEEEVNTLMHLIGWAIRKETPELKANNVRIRLFGDIARLPEEVRKDLEEGCRETSGCDGLSLNLCLSYSSRWEITNAARVISQKTLDGEISPEQIDENLFSSFLNTEGTPDPDLLIRTGGEHRISNFLLWQIAYSELYFTPVLWPDFNHEEFLKALIDYQKRERRFGKTSDQVTEENNN